MKPLEAGTRDLGAAEIGIDPSVAASARACAARWVDVLMHSKAEIIDPNADRLAAHIAAMKEAELGHAATRLARSARLLRPVMKAEAAHVHRVLWYALDDVKRQFCGALLLLSAPQLDELSRNELSRLCTALVDAWLHHEYDANCSLTPLEKELQERALQERAALGMGGDSYGSNGVGGSGGSGAGVPAADTDPLGWLRALVLGATQSLPLEERGGAFLQRHVASYLDPFLDGEVAASEYEKRSSGSYYDRLRQAWQSEMGEGVAMAIEPSLAHAQYVVHSLTKLNSSLGFGMHIPGLGRAPVNEAQAEEHLQRTVSAILEATARDFPPEQRAIGSLPCLGAEHLLPIAREHLNALTLYCTELNDALARANMKGEEGRRQERLRIWGYA